MTTEKQEKHRPLQQITLKHSLPLLVDHKPSSSQTDRKHTSAGTGNGGEVTATLGTLMLKEIREMRFLALNFIKNGNVINFSYRNRLTFYFFMA